MSRVRVLAACVVAVAVSAFAGAGPLQSVRTAGAAGEHRATIVVDTGATTYQRTVTFTEDSISGISALQRAGGNPVIYNFSGQGGAVCKIFGVGREAGPGCLGGADGDARYWAYFRAPAGSSKFTYSSVGAGATSVHNGDIEGWKFGLGTAPAFPVVTPPPTSPPPTTRPPTTRPPTTSPPKIPSSAGGAPSSQVANPQAGGAPVSGGVQAAAGTLPVTGGGPAAAKAGSKATKAAKGGGGKDTATKSGSARGTASKDDPTLEATARRAATGDSDSGSGGPLGVLAFVALALVLVGAVLLVRRSRGRASP